MGGTEERLQLVLGKPTQTGYQMVASREWTVPRESLRVLTAGLKETLDTLGLTVSDIGRIACVRGPGSFTGLRLVLAAAEGLAAGCNASLAGIDYLAMLARGPAPLLSGTLHVMTYARKGLVYLRTFNTPSMEEIFPLTSLSLDAATEQILAQGTQAVVMGSGLRKNQTYFDDFQKTHTGFTFLSKIWDNASPELLLETAAVAEFDEAHITPLYVRVTDAEDNLADIAKKRGLDPREARKRLDELQNR